MINASFPAVPLPLALGFSLLVLVLIGIITFGFYTAGLRYGSPEQSRKIALVTGGSLLLWLGLTGVLAIAGFFANFEAKPPHVLIGILPAFMVMIATIGLPKSRAWLVRLPAAWPVGLQTFRVFVEVALVAMAHSSVVPQAMTLEGRNFDILTGLTALPVAYFVHKGKLPRGLLLVWNILGLMLLVNVARIAVLATPGPLYHPTGGTQNFAASLFPFIWLPYFLVPLALFGHVISLAQLAAGREVVQEREQSTTILLTQ